MDNLEMLERIRLERPDLVIHRVIQFVENEHGFYNVRVDMEGKFFNCKIKHIIAVLPYPRHKYAKLPECEQFHWRFNNS